MPAVPLPFNLPAPAPGDLDPRRRLWGTYYYVATVTPMAGGVPLRDMAGNSLGIRLSPRAWCLAGVEGTLAVRNPDGSRRVLNYAGRGADRQTNCAGFTSLSATQVRALEKTRWGAARGPYGDGSGGYILSPFRTLAVDRTVIPLGTAIYIPQARGVRVTLPDGTRPLHDGYFFAADTGGAITGSHVDFFFGFSTTNPFTFVTSNAAGLFDAHRVTNPATIATLRNLHRI